MAVIMLAFMWGIYSSRRANWSIVAAAAIVAAGSLWFVRSQATVDQISWMKAMIPHHSIAILTSTEAEIHDPRVRRLADGIIEAQVQEIAKMRALIADLQAEPTPADAAVLAPLRVEDVAIEGAVAEALVPPGE